jgi:hypothetical protein
MVPTSCRRSDPIAVDLEAYVEDPEQLLSNLQQLNLATHIDTVRFSEL